MGRQYNRRIKRKKTKARLKRKAKMIRLKKASQPTSSTQIASVA